MNRSISCCIASRSLWTLMISVPLISAHCFFYAGTVHAAVSTSQSDLVQFTASGHILGFESKGMYVASADHMLRVEFTGASGVSPKADQAPLGNGRKKPLEQVTYENLWPGINLSYNAVTQGIMESRYVIASGADVSHIQLRYNAPVEIDAQGNLLVKYKTGKMQESAPIAWQEIGGKRIPVEIIFCFLDAPMRNHVVGFSLGQYNPTYPLIIDPTLQWNTLMGSSGNDAGSGIAVDGSGNVYVTGSSEATWGSTLNAHAGGNDAFVAKLDSSGVLLWNTFMGSSGTDAGSGIAVDSSGNVYITGQSNNTWGSPLNAHAGGNDAFVAMLDGSGVLQWNTFMGSSSIPNDNDGGDEVVVDGSGNVYVAGSSGAWGSPLNAHAGGADAFVAKLDSSGARLWHTFMGSSSIDSALGIAVDGSWNVYVAGISDATWGSPVNAHAGGYDSFVTRLDSSGARQWNTFMGSSGNDYDYAYTVAMDSSGNVYVAGSSYATWGSPVNAHAGGYDSFVAKLDSSGARQWNTFMGSSSWDFARGITVDGSGNVYVAGSSYVTWGSPVNAHAGNYDSFVAKLDSSGARQWHTFMGSSSWDYGCGIAVDGGGNLYVTGYGDGAWGSPLNDHAGDYDAFVAKLVTVGAMPWNLLLLLGD